ncbi:FAD-binding protein [Devosia sp. SL43]|uniref:FAD-binding protein n=1 Tax=Devosia sp. SL43 TaxID=2806348 RepID=UPI001F43EE68|nr:FAD-binding protein [Devosia sp. SL43]UJW86544.1 electron transfer flavoprotein subunit alpha/FixB family protein [Devosia sp. SL43]
MSVLVIAEVVGGALQRDSTARTIAAVAALGDVTVLVAGEGVGTAASEAATLAGVSKVLRADGASLAHGLAEATAELIVGVAPGFACIAAPSTPSIKNVLPRAAALLDAMVVTDVVRVIDSETFERPIYAGNALQTVRSGDGVKVLTLRTSAFSPVADQPAAPVESVVAPSDRGLSRWLSEQTVASERPDLASARVVVSGGRGVGSAENFALLETLADKLGAAIGASRAAVDAGYVGNDLQVGQTGKVVAPDIYFAIGISGAIQHLAGMKDSKVIVAINKDSEAPIFQMADFGLVGDLFDVLPELVGKL